MTRGPGTCWWSAAAWPAWKRPGCSRAGATGSGSPSTAGTPAGRCAPRPARPAGNGWPCCRTGWTPSAGGWASASTPAPRSARPTWPRPGPPGPRCCSPPGPVPASCAHQLPPVRRDPLPALDPLTVLAGGLACVPDGPVVVHDPVGGPAGVAMAEWLAAGGRTVTLVTPDQVAGTQLTRTGDLADANARLQRAGVTRALRSLLRCRPRTWPGAAGRRLDRGAAGDRLRGGRGLRPPAGADAAA